MFLFLTLLRRQGGGQQGGCCYQQCCDCDEWCARIARMWGGCCGRFIVGGGLVAGVGTAALCWLGVFSGSGLFGIDVFERHDINGGILRLFVEFAAVCCYQFNGEYFEAWLGRALIVGCSVVAEDLEYGIRLGPVCNAGVLFTYAKAFARYVVHLLLRALDSEGAFVFSFAIRSYGCRYGHIAVILDLANANIKDL